MDIQKIKLLLVHGVEVDIGRRLTDEEYNDLSSFLDRELLIAKIRYGMDDLYESVKKLVNLI